MKNLTFLRWWVLYIACIVGFVFVWKAGLVAKIAQKDDTYVSFLIVAIFMGLSPWCGFKTRAVCKAQDTGKWDEAFKKKAERWSEIGWFFSEMCLTLGMLGTVIGFVLMLGGFEQLDMNNVGSMNAFITSFGHGMSKALYATLTGIVCSILLKLQYFNLSQAIEGFKTKSEEASGDVNFSLRVTPSAMEVIKGKKDGAK